MSLSAKIVFLRNCRDVKNDVFEKKLHFLFLSVYVAARETENKKVENGKGPKPNKNSVFLRWLSKIEKNEKMDF